METKISLKYSGSYVINKNLRIDFEEKPNWFWRLMSRVLLGWIWVDWMEEIE